MQPDKSLRPACRLVGRLFLLALLFAAVICASGWLYFNHLRADTRRAARQTLSALVDLKVGQIAVWMKGYRSNAETLLHNPQILRFLAQTDDAVVREELVQWLAKFQQVYDFSAVALFDSRGVLQMAVPDVALVPEPCVVDGVQTALHARNVVFIDLHRCQSNQPVHMAFWVPIGINPRADQPAAGAVLLRIDPRRFLYPFVQNWPGSRITAEATLLRREGDEAVWLNARGHHEDSALNLRFRIHPESRLPSALAAQGREGVVDGVDHRGSAVLAAMRAIPGTPWFIVAEVGHAELYAPLRQQAGLIGLIAGLVLLVFLLAVGLMWRQQALMFARRELDERKRALEDIQSERQRFHDVLEGMPMLVCLLTADHHVAFANRAFRDRFGESRGKHCYEYCFGKTAPCDFCEAYRVLETGKPHHWMVAPPGGSFVFDVYDFPFKDIDGSPMILEVDIDITDRQRMAAKLQASETQKNAILNGITANIALVDKNLKILWANKAAADSVNQTPQEMIGHPCHFFWADPGKPCDQCPTVRAFQTKRSEHGIMRTPDGRVWDERGEPVFDAEGNVAAVVEIAQDITAKQRTEEALQQFKTIFDTANTGEIIADLNGTMIYVNDCYAAAHGYKPDELIGRRLNLCGDDQSEQMQALMEQLRRDGRFGAREVRHARRDGVVFPMMMTGSLVRDAQGAPQCIAVTAIDLSEYRALENRLHHSEKMESVGRLAGGIAHDFNNILQVVLGNMEMILARIDPGNSLRPDLEEVFNAGRRGAALVRQLLGFTRKQPITPRVMDLNTAVAGMLKMIKRLIGENIDIVWSPAPDLWPVMMDPIQIDQILVNLCVNARDVIAGAGTVTIASQNVSVDQLHAARHDGVVPGDYVMLSVSDTGCGMDRETQAMMFEPFFTTKQEGEGTGLGLATVYGIVRQNQGYISVYSEPNMGTCLHIYLPRCVGAAAAPAAQGAAKPLSQGSEMVLVVEDDAIILNMISRILRKLGYTVLAAGTPEAALRLAEENADQLQLLLSDIVMPGMNGQELARQMKARLPNLKCLLMSGFTENEIARKGILDGSSHFIRKPFAMEDLAAKIRLLLSGAPSPDG